MMPQLAIHLISTICGIDYFDQENLTKFVLTMRKSYHNNPYHNFEHGFHVCHCMFNIVYRNVDVFNAIEVILAYIWIF